MSVFSTFGSTPGSPFFVATLSIDGAARQLAAHCALVAQSPFEIRLTLDKRNGHLLTDNLRGLTKRSEEEVLVDVDKASRRERRLTDQLKVSEEREALEARLQEAPQESAETLKEKLTTTRDRAAKARERYDALATAKKLQHRIDSLTLEIEALTRDADQAALLQRKTRLAERVSTDRQELEDLATKIVTTKHKREEVEALETERLQLRVEVKKSRRLVEDRQILTTLREGFQYLLQRRERIILQQVTEHLPTYTTPLLGDQARWVQVGLVEDGEGIDLRVSAAGDELPQHGPSPGMRAKIGLGLVFALRSLYSQRLASNLLVLDEPIHRIDTRARPGFVSILNDLRKHVETCIVITHESEVIGASFDKRWQAMIKDGVSTLLS